MWPENEDTPAPAAAKSNAAKPEAAPEFVPPAPPPFVSPAPPAAFHAVSQHDEVTEDAHKPVRHRRQPDAAAKAEALALKLVETQAPVVPLQMEDELPRRTKPRRRRGSETSAEPLVLVETDKSVEPGRGEVPPAQ
jgi:hypothetical protein